MTAVLGHLTSTVSYRLLVKAGTRWQGGNSQEGGGRTWATGKITAPGGWTASQLRGTERGIWKKVIDGSVHLERSERGTD